MFTVQQYLDKYFKLNGLGKAQDTDWREAVGGGFFVVGGMQKGDSVLSSMLLYTGLLLPFPSPCWCC